MLINRIKCLLVLLFSISMGAFAQVKINEYSCGNVEGAGAYTDVFGRTPDWFEIYNPSSTTPVNISGFYVTDDPNNLGKFQFPLNTIIPADSFITVFASGRDTVVTGQIHTNFNLYQTNPTIHKQIIITNIAGTMVDSVILRRHQRRHSWGRWPDGSASWRVFVNPTPVNSNTNSPEFFGYLKPPLFSVQPGFYGSAVTLTLDPNSQIGVGIRYSTDCSDPTMAGTTFIAAPIILLSTTVVRAICFDPLPGNPSKFLPSFIETNTYFIPGAIYQNNFSMDVVSVCMDTTGGGLPGGDSSLTVLEYFDNNKVFKFETVGFSSPTGTAFTQIPFTFKAEDEFGYNYVNSYPFFNNPTLGASNRTEHESLVFNNAGNDNFILGGQNNQLNPPGLPAHLRDAFCQTFASAYNLNFDVSHYRPVTVFVNGKYKGVFETREVFDSLYTSHYYNENNIHNINNSNPIWANTVNASTEWTNLYTYIMSNSMIVPSNYMYVDSLIDLSSYIDYMIYNTYLMNTDFINTNTGWWRGIDTLTQTYKKWRFRAVDMDNTMGLGEDNSGFGSAGPDTDPCVYQTTYPVGSPAQQGTAAMLTRLMANDTFKSNFITRYGDLLNTVLTCPNLKAHLNTFRGILQPEMIQHSDYFGGNDTIWNIAIDTIDYWLDERCNKIKDEIKNCWAVTGPFDFCIEISPDNAGSVSFNTLNITSTYSGQYFGNVYMSAIAVPSTNYYFDHWEPSGFTLADSLIKEDSLYWRFDSISCLKAVFKLKEPYNTDGEPLLPTGFSPNGDGNNDLFNVYGTLRATDYLLEIYNRWGQQVFQSSDKTLGWDGKYKGEDVPIGVYAYRFKVMIDGKEFIKSGNITLIR